MDPVGGAAERPHPKRSHAVIAGTGRTGTTFLVRFLQACGLDVDADPEAASDADRSPARAGLEHYLLDEGGPYVVKDPWLHTYCHEVDLQQVSIDALIVPTRDLLDGATSRIFQERIAMVDSEWRNRPPVELRGGAAGGIVYSLDPVDQARILAVGFHRLVHWAVSHQIPLFLLDFPRSVNDPDYLVSTLAPWLRAHCSDEVALSAFARVADPGSVRFGQPEAPDLPATMSAEGLGIERRALADALDQRDAALRTAEEVLATTAASLADARARLAACEDLLAQAQADRDSLQRSLSWRLTSPLRAVRRRVR